MRHLYLYSQEIFGRNACLVHYARDVAVGYSVVVAGPGAWYQAGHVGESGRDEYFLRVVGKVLPGAVQLAREYDCSE